MEILLLAKCDIPDSEKAIDVVLRLFWKTWIRFALLRYIPFLALLCSVYSVIRKPSFSIANIGKKNIST